MTVPVARWRTGESRTDETVLRNVSFAENRWEICLRTCLSVANDTHILESFDAIVLFEFHRYLFDSLVEDRPQYLSILSYEVQPIL